MSTFDKTKPNAGESPDQAPTQLNANFDVIKEITSKDHEWDDTPVTNSGKHNQSTYLEQSASQPTTLANESAIWAVEGPSSTQTELYIRRENSSGALSVPTKDLAILGVSACGLFNGSGAALGTHNINMTCTRSSTGIFLCNFTNSMPDANYMYLITAQDTSVGTDPRLVSWRVNTKTASSLQVVFTHRVSSTTSLIDPTSFTVIIYGGIQ